MTSETPEESRNASGETASSEERCSSKNVSGETASGEDEISLNIAGHEEEKRKREGTDANPFADADSDTDTDGTPAENGDDSTILDEVAAEAPDADDDEAEPVELLVQLAEEGEIEPWDIDIVTVTDKFLDRLDEVDLRTSGRALFYASVLLRMKSDALLADDDEDEEPEDPWDEWGPGMDAPMDGDGEFPAHDPVDQLEAEMERRLDRKTARGTPETLDELVRELRERERGSWWKESRSYDTSNSPGGFERGTQTLDYRMDDGMRMDDEPSEEDALGTAHGEDIEAVIDDVRAELDTHYESGREEVLYAEIETAGGSRIETFLAVLFLSHREVVVLEQDDLFGDLWVRDADVVAEADADDPEAEVVAD